MLPSLLKEIRPDLCEYLGVSDEMFVGHDIAIVVGNNGSGKSFLRRMFATACREQSIHCFDLSQERRTQGGIQSSLIYGDESWQNTGSNTLHTFKAGLRERNDGPYLLIWDEPEIG